ncbi:MAG: ABC transporter ATP-binding protein [Candidatus Nomurabacteria bacterium]|jgi:ABC-2 type transport system ATP-binding protein|nr:ABC transporter ATP-binding protein [Candidatus Nomurabacteria bacterium]
MNVISVKKLNKSFGTKQALSDVSFEVAENSITGFLGPNGAGKSTAMNILLGFIAADDGKARIFDEKVSVSNHKIHKDIGFLSSNMALDKTLTAGQEIEYFGHLAKNYDAQKVADLAKKLDLDLNQKIGSMSTGNHQKVALMVALLAEPKLLILDEPTNGLDPLVQAEFNKIIMQLHAKGSTIFISSHVLSEIEELCDNFIFIRDGKIAAQLSKDDLHRKSQDKIVVETNAKNKAKIQKFLRDNKIKFAEESGDLESTFMKYYSGKEERDA